MQVPSSKFIATPRSAHRHLDFWYCSVKSSFSASILELASEYSVSSKLPAINESRLSSYFSLNVFSTLSTVYWKVVVFATLIASCPKMVISLQMLLADVHPASSFHKQLDTTRQREEPHQGLISPPPTCYAEDRNCFWGFCMVYTVHNWVPMMLSYFTTCGK